MKSLEEMAAQGKSKLDRRVTSMASNYNAAKGRAKEHYALTPFSARIKEEYNKGVDAAVYHAPDTTKWSTNWKAKMSGG